MSRYSQGEGRDGREINQVQGVVYLRTLRWERARHRRELKEASGAGASEGQRSLRPRKDP